MFTGPGGNEVVRLEERPDPVPGPDEVLVSTRFAGINWADVAQRDGRYPVPVGAPPDVAGLEVCGIVETCGSAVVDWKPGDRLFGIVGGGGLADRVLAHGRHVTAVPTLLEDDVAAAVPESFVTAHDAVFTRGRLGLGEVLLVNGANGAVGSAAVQLGLAAGARVVAGVRSVDAGRDLAERGAVVVTPEQVAECVAALGGADVILELVGSPNLELDLGAVATEGRIVVIGTSAATEATISLRGLMAKRVSLTGSTLRARSLEGKANAVQAFVRAVVPLLEQGRVAPRVERVFEASDAAAAFDHLSTPGKIGKILLEFS